MGGFIRPTAPAAGRASRRLVDEGGLEARPADRSERIIRKTELGGERRIFRADRRAEEGRVVGTDGHADAGLHQLTEWVAGDVGIEPERDVRAGAKFEYDPFCDDALDKGRILDRADAMADALDAEMVERGADAVRPPELAGMDRQAKARLAGDAKGVLEITRVVHPLVAGDAEAGHQRMWLVPLPSRRRRARDRDRRCRTPVATSRPTMPRFRLRLADALRRGRST